MQKKRFIYAGLLLAIAGVLYVMQRNKQKGKLELETPQDNYVSPPFEGVDIPRVLFDVNTEETTVLNYGSTVLTIPGCAFLDSNGQVVTGEVKLSYREVNNPIDIMISGVPMEIQEGSGQYFESAGMMEMLAWKDNTPLMINPACKIQVKTTSTYADNNYNFYNLDTVNRKWVENASSLPTEQVMQEKMVEENAPATIKEPDYNALAEKAGLVNPVKPREKDKQLFQFKFKTDFTKYPELNIYEGVQWEFAGKKSSEDPAKNRWVITAIWREMEIVKRKKNGIYKLRLASKDRAFTTTVRPVFDGEDMEYAEYVFNEKYTAFKKFVDAKKEEARQWRLKQEKLAKERAQRKKVYELTDKFSREFNVEGFGWANIDRIRKINAQTLAVSFKDKSGNKVPVSKVYLIMDSVNTVLNFSKHQLERFVFDTKAKNSLIIIDSLTNTYVVNSRSFEQVSPAAKKHQFIVKNPKRIKSEADIRKLLKNG